ncbi:MAG TPA: GlxA family transcriptional regulator [Steroidobacteraceae bacterium]|nr:GlxA family transcriptional regulator [Steroidobacteraceae bacterium]
MKEQSAPQLRATRYAFLTLENYSMIALSSAVEPLRMANLVTGQRAYHWSIATLDGAPAIASNGLSLAPTVALAELNRIDILFVCGGIEVRAAVSGTVLAHLRRAAERGTPLGALCTGGYALAKAGLLDGYRATIHWENLSALREEFPRVIIRDRLFTIDRDRFTCSGGIAPLDLMLSLVKEKLGARTSQLISEQFIVERVRDDRDRQYVPLRAQLGSSHANLIEIAQVMEKHVEEPLPLDQIAAAASLSRRQIERLFRRYLDCAPKQYYLQVRLKRARELLTQTPLSIMEVSVACGFRSAHHFSKCYRAYYGRPPSAERDSGRIGAAR